jgi:ASC-1-like (ASCH) protein
LGNAKIRGCYGTYLKTNRLNDEKRKLVRVGDIIRFQKLPNLDEEFIVDIKKH